MEKAKEGGDGMLLDDDELDHDQQLALLDMIDEEVEDYEDNRDTMLLERDSTVLKNIRNTISSKHESIKQSEQAVGTPLYLSPEIWTSKEYTKAGDIWAIGIILHEILTLKHPFQASTMDELKRKVCNDSLPKIKTSLISEELV